MFHFRRTYLITGLTGLLATLASCGDSDGRSKSAIAAVESCMQCHNGSKDTDYSGPGIENPHPFGTAANLTCTVCHGGNPAGETKDTAHVPPPPEIGDRDFQEQNNRAYFNKLTLTGMDKFPDYTVNGVTYTSLQYLQFVNPGDLRVVTLGRACGQCHAPHAETVAGSPLATETGVFSGSTYSMGVDNQIPAHVGLYEDTAADLSFRAVLDTDYNVATANLGEVGRLIEFPVYSHRNDTGPNAIRNNQNYTAANLANDIDGATGRVISGSELANLFHEQIAFTCGDCHLGSSGANNRTGDYRSSGCTSCHMPYSLGGRAGTSDPNVNKLEPLDPDDIDDPERPHVRSHRIMSVYKTLSNGITVQGIDDYACAGCHQGSNRTVMQYWGIRLDQNEDLRRGVQYPAQPVSFQTTRNDTRLFDPVLNNNEFNGRDHNQYILFEDYDGDGRDDTPEDVHYAAGMGCIDCHGTFDLHGGDANNPSTARIKSRQEHATAIKCESCHGSATAYAPVKPGQNYSAQTVNLAYDSKGIVLRNVVREGDGHMYLYSRLTGKKHYVSQTRDVVVDSGVRNPITNALVYSPKGSYAMGRTDGSATTGTGPRQTGDGDPGFSHSDNMDCASCHSSWTNTCMGCHLEGEYDNGNNFSNITGQRIVFRERFAEFVYQSPVFFQLGVNSDGKITSTSSNTKTFFRYLDLNNDRSQVFTFTDRNGNGTNPSTAFPSLGHNAMMAHSIRGRVSSTNEGARNCVACHMTTTGRSDFDTQNGAGAYAAYVTAMNNDTFSALNFNLLATHIGRNPGNQLNSPLWVHMVAGRGTGLFLFDQNGCPINPLDNDNNRFGCEGNAPANNFNLANVRFNLDKIVNSNGSVTGSSNHPIASGLASPLRAGTGTNQRMAGPLGQTLVNRLSDPATGIVLESWIDADGNLQGNAINFVR